MSFYRKALREESGLGGRRSRQHGWPPAGRLRRGQPAKVPREVSEMKIGRILRLSSLTGNGIKH